MRTSQPEENIIVGNVALYGATSRATPISAGVAGERFCVRNSGATAVVEGVGRARLRVYDRRLVWWYWDLPAKTLRAGMSGGVAYVLDEESELYRNLNRGDGPHGEASTPSLTRRSSVGP